MIESLMAAKIRRSDGDRLEILVTLVEAHERSHFPMDFPDAIEAIKFKKEQAGLTLKDLEPVIGRKNRAYEVLSRKRPLTLRMIEGLHLRFGIPAESLPKQRVTRSEASVASSPTRKMFSPKTDSHYRILERIGSCGVGLGVGNSFVW